MNRIQNPAKPKALGPGLSSLPAFEVDSATFRASAGDSTRAMFVPLHYEPGYAYPLIVWLHGSGPSDERQLLRVMPVVSMRNYLAVAPRGFPGGGEGEAPECGWPQTPERIEEAERRVFDAIEAAMCQYHVATDRIFIAGFDAGGTMAFRVAMNHPSRFAGVISLCGAFAQGFNPFRGLVQARRLPIFLAVGRDSLRYSPAHACADLRLFHTAGMSIALRQYPCGHQLAPQMLRDLDRWIIEQITTPPDSDAQSDQPWSCWQDG